MGLIINATEEKKITIIGTQIELPNVYGRIEFAGRADGKTLEIAINTYASKEAYESGANTISTDVPQGSFTTQIEEGEIQSIDTAHKYAKIAYDQQGYNTIIDLTTL